MTAEHRPAHSPLGASSAERWMSCPGSVALIKRLNIQEETDEPEYRGLGIAAHEAGAYALKNNIDAWELIGEKFHGLEVDTEMARAIQVYIDTVRPGMETDGAVVYIEHGLGYKEEEGHAKEIIDSKAGGVLKKYFYGTGDCGVVLAGGKRMVVTDYKHGEGIIVEAYENPQLMYYAFGFLLLHPSVETVMLQIVQPRTFDDAVKEWEISADFIRGWINDQLVPAMLETEINGAALDAGSWCRFCPAKLVCPMMASLFGAACTANPKAIVPLTDETLGRSYQKRQAVNFYLKAMEEEVFQRLNRGTIVPGCKLVPKKANRVLVEGGADVFKQKFGDDAFTKPEIKSPAELEKLGAGAKELVKQYAYTPQTGLTVATDDDRRVAVKVEPTAKAFAGFLDKFNKGDENA